MSALLGSSARLRTMTASWSKVSLSNCTRHLKWQLDCACLLAEGVCCSSIYCRNCLKSESAKLAVINFSLV